MYIEMGMLLLWPNDNSPAHKGQFCCALSVKIASLAPGEPVAPMLYIYSVAALRKMGK